MPKWHERDDWSCRALIFRYSLPFADEQSWFLASTFNPRVASDEGR
ncbi:hypothetical protein RB6423 [Rhodopirellula baltica SH 1]|uniref:Uncharacterized protein n=1 Tax=Rhodopirellula baltica (strain DSM 10527 / NCIMB 13988 / SH1) TaxID=243090 RepID=Q7UQB4_RHOBA|nr:hypothetical protein RB6423 [Rhodopirellula baltica SH 1]